MSCLLPMLDDAVHLLVKTGVSCSSKWWPKSTSRVLGAGAMADVLAKVVKPRVRVDATASKATASRRGVGRVRHFHTNVLWVAEN